MIEEVEQINDDLDVATEFPFDSEREAYDAIHIILEKYQIIVPKEEFDDSKVFKLENQFNTPLYLYICMDENNDGKYEAFASIVDEDELNALFILCGDEE